MSQRAFGCLGAFAATAREVVRLTLQPPGAREPELVAEFLKHGDRSIGGIDELLGRDSGVGEQTEKATLHESAGRQQPVAGGRRSLYRLRQNPVGPDQIAVEGLHCAYVRDELDAQRVVGREHGYRARDKLDAGGRVALREGAAACVTEFAGCFVRERKGRLVRRPELREAEVRVFEVVPDELFVFLPAIAG